MALGLQVGSRERQLPANTVNQQVCAWGWGGRSKRGEETNKQHWNGSVGALTGLCYSRKEPGRIREVKTKPSVCG